MLATKLWLDRAVGRLLFVKAQSIPEVTRVGNAERAFSFSLIVSGIRCILQYAVLPFVLPTIGVSTEIAVPISLAINVFAIVLIVYSLRRFWQIDYSYKWQYLIVALVALVLLITFVALDLDVITAN